MRLMTIPLTLAFALTVTACNNYETKETEVESLNEHVNVAALKELASRKAADVWRPYGGATLRTILMDFISQVKDNHIQTV